MISSANQDKLARFIAFSLFAITICVATGGVTDPVNNPKLLMLGIFAFASLGILISMYEHILDKMNLGLLIVLSLFLLFAVISTIKSDSPLSQNLYGVYGRNNGLLTYIFLCILFYAASLIKSQQNVFRILKGLIYGGCVNLVYCLWVILFGDFMPWNNTYGNILGTFGNPNFIGAFFGMLFGVLFALLVGTRTSRKNQIYIFLVIPLLLFEIYQTRAIQGVVLVVISLFAVVFYYIKCHLKKAYLAIYSALVLATASFGIAGGLQIGPLSKLVYKESVSLRWQYWLAAWNTGKDNPLNGVGMDSFGDWYRRAREIQALERPGLNVVVNAAHNVFLDMLAFGGWPLLLTYVVLVGLTVRAVIIITLRMKSYDPVGVMLITAWLCYQAQSIISINQIGLAIWGWALGGALIGYARIQEINERTLVKSASKTKKEDQIKVSEPRTLVFGFIFGVVGMLISIPPLSADTKLRSAQVSLSGDLIMDTTKSTYFNPLNTQKFILNIQSFETAGLFDLAHQQAIQAIQWNPESFELWRLLFLIKNSTEDEKKNAVKNMRRLDPLNTEIESKI